jgi:hypothetical protein
MKFAVPLPVQWVQFKRKSCNPSLSFDIVPVDLDSSPVHFLLMLKNLVVRSRRKRWIIQYRTQPLAGLSMFWNMSVVTGILGIGFLLPCYCRTRETKLFPFLAEFSLAATSHIGGSPSEMFELASVLVRRVLKNMNARFSMVNGHFVFLMRERELLCMIYWSWHLYMLLNVLALDE